MDPAQLDHDSRAALRRKALGNARSLAESLDYNDKLDRKEERRFAVFAAVAVTVVLAGLAISAAWRAPEPGALEMTRCVQAGRVDAMWALRAELERQYPEMRATERDKLVEKRYDEVANAAHVACAAKLRKAS